MKEDKLIAYLLKINKEYDGVSSVEVEYQRKELKYISFMHFDRYGCELTRFYADEECKWKAKLKSLEEEML